MYLIISLFYVFHIYVIYVFLAYCTATHIQKSEGAQPYVIKITSPPKIANMELKLLPKQSASLSPAAFFWRGENRYISFELLNQAGRSSSAQEQFIVNAGG